VRLRSIPPIRLVLRAEPEAEGAPLPEPEPESDAELEAEPAAERVLVAVPDPELEPEPEPEADDAEPDPLPEVVSLALRDPTPRAWNIWQLEELAATKDGEPEKVEERAILLLHLRQFANPAGELPTEFDPLVREAFGADLAELVT
jgi:hypothetical protein